ncbi:MAG: peptide deformylase [Holosporaceae bacterium]|nr:peptide deformylase [Holosporaceae bacterium]
MELRIYPDPILSEKCAKAEPDDSDIPKILEEMCEKLYQYDGAGLAAPQIGILKRIIVADVREEPRRLYKMINPVITWKSEETIESKEGCLSLPFLREKIFRHESITVEYLDENFIKQEIQAFGFLSCCLQHEIDHLDGILYIDRLSRLKKSRAIRKFKKLQIENDPEDGI